jgi:hypothetical protein
MQSDLFGVISASRRRIIRGLFAHSDRLLNHPFFRKIGIAAINKKSGSLEYSICSRCLNK